MLIRALKISSFPATRVGRLRSSRSVAGEGLCGALSWLVTPEQWSRFLSFEQAIHQAVIGSEIIGLCSYPIRPERDDTERVLLTAIMPSSVPRLSGGATYR